MKTYRRYSDAKKAANGAPILEIIEDNAKLFVVFSEGANPKTTMISLIREDGMYTGCVTARHLDRLGNANHAQAAHSRSGMHYSYNHTPTLDALRAEYA
jgi:hypothetical protein